LGGSSFLTYEVDENRRAVEPLARVRARRTDARDMLMPVEYTQFSLNKDHLDSMQAKLIPGCRVWFF
jgi:hypothetical protein